MCDVPSIASFYSESIECFPSMASKFFFKPFFTIPVVPIITGMIIRFMYHIRCISLHKLLYFSFSSALHSRPLILPNLSSMRAFSVFILIIISWPICHNACICVYHLSVLAVPMICILRNVSVPQLSPASISPHSSPEWGILRLACQ